MSDPIVRRIAYVLMSYPVILNAAADQSGVVVSTLPADARVSHIILLPEHQQAQVYFESALLDPVFEGALIPEYVVRLTRQYDAVA